MTKGVVLTAICIGMILLLFHGGFLAYNLIEGNLVSMSINILGMFMALIGIVSFSRITFDPE